MKSYPYLAKLALLALVTGLWLATSIAADGPPQVAETSIKHVDAKQAEQLIKDRKVTVLDIRTPSEFKAGRIAGATNIDFMAGDFDERIKGLDKTKPYLVHCAVGGRSSRSLATFKRQRFQSIYHLDGGIKAWEKAGLPLEK